MNNNFYVQVSPDVRYGPFTKREANALIKKLKGKCLAWHPGDRDYTTFSRYPFLVERTQHGRPNDNSDT